MAIEKEFRMPLADEVKDKTEGIIKVIGVGGGGVNAVNNMYHQGIHNVFFVACNTDSQSLVECDVPYRLQLGDGLGTGGNPEKGREMALENMDEINRMFDDGTQMVFITAGMGGGTGTGAAPVIASAAKQRGVLTVGIVTVPFYFEKMPRIRKAVRGVEEMRKNVDALLVINNERLRDIYGRIAMSVREAYVKADEILGTAAKTIAEIITLKGVINRDFCDVQTVMKDGGSAIMSVGYGEGEYRLNKAILDALDSPLLSDNNVVKAKRVLFIVYSSKEYPLLIEELDVLDDFMEEFDSDVELIWGQYEDDTLGAKAKFAIIATGVENAMPEDRHETAQLDEYIHRLYRSRKPLSPKEPDKGKPDEEKLSLPENDRSEDEIPPVSQESVANKIRNKWMKRFEQWADWVYKD